jgi:predicted Zn-dependent protease
LDSLRKLAGEDPYLDVLAANLLRAMGDYAGAIRRADKAIAAEPDLAEAYRSKVETALAQKDFATVAAVLTILETKLGEKLSDMTKEEVYSEFVKSPQYATWQKSRKTAKRAE